jgi:hypothetical protein
MLTSFFWQQIIEFTPEELEDQKGKSAGGKEGGGKEEEKQKGKEGGPAKE